VQRQIPMPLVAVISDVFSTYYTHTQIESRFFMAGFPQEVPEGNKQQKCHEWLRRANKEMPDPLSALGCLIEELMEAVPPPSWGQPHPVEGHRQRIESQLSAHGLSYQKGGYILQLGSMIATRTLQEIVHERDLKGVQQEFDRIFSNLDSDPQAAVTASCALLEALFKGYIADEGLQLPADQSVLPLWKVVRSHLHLDPSQIEDDGLKKILSGMASIVDGTAALRTRRGSAHGHDTRTTIYRIEARHARLTAHAAMALATFVIESSEARLSR